MAIFRLRGDAEDWSDVNSWYGGTVPTSGTDTVVIIGESGSKPVSLGLDQSAVSINSIRRLPGVRKAIGDGGAPLKIDVDNGTAPAIIDAGDGGSGFTMYIDGKCPNVQLRGSAGYAQKGGAIGDTMLVVAGGALLDVSDQATIGATANGGAIRVIGGSAKVMKHATDRIGDAIVMGGTLETERDWAMGDAVGSGVFVPKGTAKATDGGTPDLGRFRLLSPSAVLRMQNTEAVTFANVDLLAGRMDFTRAIGDFTASDGAVDNSAVFVPKTYAGGVTDVSATTEAGVQQESISA